MCGIWGRLGEAGRAATPEVVDRALGALAHRGPDGRGVWWGDRVVLGACRLAVIDVSGGAQPIVDEERRCCIVYNGELYNHRELRAELEAHGERFRTRCDTEVVLRAYLRWGFDCLKRFNGMYAFAIWDGRARALFLARDRVGEKPLYYRHDERGLTFASEIKAILADPEVPREVHLPGLANFLAFDHGVAPDTIFRGIRKLPPGHYLVSDAASVQITPYWEPAESARGAETRSIEAWAEELRALLEDSTRRRLVADVPVGVFLSGGLDSSAVAALAARHCDGPLRTFTLGFAAGRPYDERREAARVARELGSEHHELEVGAIDLPATLRELVVHYDEPFADPAAFPLLLLSRFARERATVALVGDGGDELFGGYRRVAVERLAPLWGMLPAPLAERALPGLIHGLPRMRRAKLAATALAVREPARRYAAWVALFPTELWQELLEPEVARRLGAWDPNAALARHYAALPDLPVSDHLNRLMYVDLMTWLPDKMLEKTDKASMAASLEVRSPLLDHRIVELALRIPSRLKVGLRRGKLVLRRAVADIVPSFVLRRRKQGFTVPLDPWFRDQLRRHAAEILLDGRTQRRGWLDGVVVERLLAEHRAGRHVWGRQIFALTCLELWARAYLDRTAG
jgi:asparagine synthase (glutamine-hydrolysing)